MLFFPPRKYFRLRIVELYLEPRIGSSGEKVTGWKECFFARRITVEVYFRWTPATAIIQSSHKLNIDSRNMTQQDLRRRQEKKQITIQTGWLIGLRWKRQWGVPDHSENHSVLNRPTKIRPTRAWRHMSEFWSHFFCFGLFLIHCTYGIEQKKSFQKSDILRHKSDNHVVHPALEHTMVFTMFQTGWLNSTNR